MELLVVTLAYIAAERVADALACASMVSDTLRNAPGLVSARLYRGRGETRSQAVCCLVFSTWEDNESWLQARERYNPRSLFQNLALPGMLCGVPEQWFMRYIWGYNRPITLPMLAAVHLANVYPNQQDFAQRGWLKGLRRQGMHPNLSFAFLARGVGDNDPTERALAALDERDVTGFKPHQSEAVFLNLFSWSNENEIEAFYASPYYQAIDTLVRTVGVVRLLSLEPL